MDSGRNTSRPQLAELLRFARDRDAVEVHSMDRLARNLDDLRAPVQGLPRKEARVKFVKDSLVFTGEGAFAELEPSLIRESGGKESPWRSSAETSRDGRRP